MVRHRRCQRLEQAPAARRRLVPGRLQECSSANLRRPATGTHCSAAFSLLRHHSVPSAPVCWYARCERCLVPGLFTSRRRARRHPARSRAEKILSTYIWGKETNTVLRRQRPDEHVLDVPSGPETGRREPRSRLTPPSGRHRDPAGSTRSRPDTSSWRRSPGWRDHRRVSRTDVTAVSQTNQPGHR
jgi:hypothetical protein